MYDTPTGHAVRASLEAVAGSKEAPSEHMRDALEARVCDAVDELKAMGWPIEQIIARLKELAYDVGLPLHSESGKADRAAIIAEIVRVCIRRYFEN